VWEVSPQCAWAYSEELAHLLVYREEIMPIQNDIDEIPYLVRKEAILLSTRSKQLIISPPLSHFL